MSELTCGTSTTNELLGVVNNLNLGGKVAKKQGRTVEVSALYIGGFSGADGEITLPINGVWYVGYDLFTKAVITLPRLGHSGWIPLARCVTDADAVTLVQPITPVMPTCRLPKAVTKVARGEKLSVAIIGSSLAATNNDTSWVGMLLRENGSLGDYKIAKEIVYTNNAVGGAPNMYGLAQTGFFGENTAKNFGDSGYPGGVSAKNTHAGASNVWKGVDVAIITCLANGGNRRLDCIEPTVRNLRKMGIEVLIVSDNATGAPHTYSNLLTSSWYKDGEIVRSVANRYGAQFADTAAYVGAAELMHPEIEIYADPSHMTEGTPNGRTEDPSCGHEVWARAIRSTIPVDQGAIDVGTFTFDADSEGWEDYISANTTTYWSGGKQRAEKVTDDSTTHWGHSYDLPPHKVGDIVEVTFTYSASFVGNMRVGVQLSQGSWGSNQLEVPAGTHTLKLVSTAENNTGNLVLIAVNLKDAGETMDIDNVSICIKGGAERINKSQELVAQVLPDSLITTDMTLPAGASTILPRDEVKQEGTLSTSPRGANSFARRADKSTPSSEDILTLTVGEAAALGGNGVVSFALVVQSVIGSDECVFGVYQNDTLVKTVTFEAQTKSKETYLPILTPDELAVTSPSPRSSSIDIRVTAGTLYIAGLVTLTSEQSFLTPEEISYVGTWGDKVSGGSPTMLGYATDTLDDYATVRCPLYANRLSWVVTGKAVSKPVDIWSGLDSNTAVAVAGTSNIKTIGELVGAGTTHYIQCKETLAGGGDTTNGWGLHVGGAILTHDR